MPDGPPWIRNIDERPWLWSGLNPGQNRLTTGYRVELDENRRWTIQFSTERPTGSKIELCVNLLKPASTSGGGFQNSVRFINYNDHYPNSPGAPGQTTITGYKFDNEDIYINAMHNSGGWIDCARKYAQKSGPHDNRLEVCFTGPQNTTLTVSFQLEGQP